MQPRLDLSSRSFLFIFPNGGRPPCNIYPGDYQKDRGDAARSQFLHLTHPPRILTPASQGPLGVPLSRPAGSLSSLPWQALEQFPS